MNELRGPGVKKAEGWLDAELGLISWWKPWDTWPLSLGQLCEQPIYSSLWLNQPKPVRAAAHLNEKTKQTKTQNSTVVWHAAPSAHRIEGAMLRRDW